MINVKIVIAFAALAFVISVLSGIAGGVAFGALALRTFLGSLLFAGLGAGVSWVFGRYLAQEEEGGSSADATQAQAADAEEGAGDEVDIVLPEENPHLEDAAEEEESLEQEETLEEQETFGSDAVEDLEAVGDMDDIEELPGVESAGEAAEAEEEDEDRELEDAEPGEPLESFAGTEGEFADLDAMPALESLGEGTSYQQEAQEKEQESSPVKGVKPVDVMGTAHDPEEAAKAIKTWLKKDEKG